MNKHKGEIVKNSPENICSGLNYTTIYHTFLDFIISIHNNSTTFFYILHAKTIQWKRKYLRKTKEYILLESVGT